MPISLSHVIATREATPMQTEPETVQSIIAEIARTLGYSTGAVPTQIDEKKPVTFWALKSPPSRSQIPHQNRCAVPVDTTAGQ